MSKTENTSQTYGQMIAFDNGESLSPGQSFTIVNIANVVSDYASIDLDKAKLQIAVAVANNVTTPITLPLIQSSSQIYSTGIDGGNAANFIVNGSVYVVNSNTLQKTAVASSLNLSKQIDFLCAYKTIESDEIEFNNMQVPDITSQLNYQFYIPNETDIASQEDPNQDPLLTSSLSEVPRYVNVSWQAVSTTNQLTVSSQDISNGATAQALKQKALGEKRGKINATGMGKQTFQNSNKRMNKVNKNGKKLTLTDVQNLDDAINSVSNENIFNNIDIVQIGRASCRERV